MKSSFPNLKEVKDFDFDFQPSINPQQIYNLLTLRFIEGNENIVFLGQSGVGKTFLASAIGIEAAKKRTSTYFVKCHDLIQNLIEGSPRKSSREPFEALHKV